MGFFFWSIPFLFLGGCTPQTPRFFCSAAFFPLGLFCFAIACWWLVCNSFWWLILLLISRHKQHLAVKAGRKQVGFLFGFAAFFFWSYFFCFPPSFCLLGGLHPPNPLPFLFLGGCTPQTPRFFCSAGWRWPIGFYTIMNRLSVYSNLSWLYQLGSNILK